MAMIDELIEAVAQADGISKEQSVRAVRAMLRFLAARLPSPLFGELQTRLQGAADDTARLSRAPDEPKST